MFIYSTLDHNQA